MLNPKYVCLKNGNLMRKNAGFTCCSAPRVKTASQIYFYPLSAVQGGPHKLVGRLQYVVCRQQQLLHIHVKLGLSAMLELLCLVHVVYKMLPYRFKVHTYMLWLPHAMQCVYIFVFCDVKNIVGVSATK